MEKGSIQTTSARGGSIFHATQDPSHGDSTTSTSLTRLPLQMISQSPGQPKSFKQTITLGQSDGMKMYDARIIQETAHALHPET